MNDDQGQGQAQAQIDPRSRLRISMETFWKEIKWQVYLLYGRWVYQHHMRWLHRRGKHWWKHYALIDGPEFDKCEWCGAMQNINPERI
jgi:hypothetical protein